MPILGKEDAEGAAAPLQGEGTFAQLWADACLSVQRPGTPCRGCAEACPADAVRVGERTIEIIAEACVGCGRCAASCPTEAIAIEGFAVAVSRQRLRLECSRVPSSKRSSGDCVVPCLGGITVGHLRSWLTEGEDAIVLIDRGWCENCPAGGSAAPWSSTFECVKRELESLDARARDRIDVECLPLPVSIALDPPSPRKSARSAFTRRELFARLSRSQPKAGPPPAATAEDAPPRTVSVDALLARRRQLSKLAGGDLLPGSMFPSIAIADTCCNNQICVRACPTEALRSVEEDKVDGIDFNAALCIACGACANACPTDSISVRAHGEGTYEGAVSLRRHARQACPHCGIEFVPTDSQPECLACRKDAEIAQLGHGLMRNRSFAADEMTSNEVARLRHRPNRVEEVFEREGAR